jgi:Arc/MetJ family transcription regulator
MKSDLIKNTGKLGKGALGTLTDAVIIDQLAAYKRRIAGGYRPLSEDEIEKLPSGKMWVSEKIDGELWFLISISERTFLSNPRGEVIDGNVPVLAQVGKLNNQTIIAGELHARKDGSRARVGDLASLMSGGGAAKTEAIGFAAFDLIQEDGASSAGAYEERLERLKELIKEGSNLRVIPSETIGTAEIRSLYKKRVVTGEIEGLVIRAETGMTYKLKPLVTIDAAIVAYTTKADQPDSIRSILLALMHEDGSYQLLGGCGNMGSEDDRKALLTKLSALKTESSARYASDGGGLYTFVKPELVAEITVTDLQAQRSDGSMTQSLMIHHGASGWASAGMRPAPRPIHPVMTRLRTDKKVDQTDVRFAQVEPYIPVIDQSGSDEPLPKSEIIRREVWTKEAKGQTAVRKLVVLKTNKEAVNSAFPAYVVHWSDYSAGRATPLDKEVRLAPSEAEAMKIAEGMIGDNIKKGWEKV